MTGYEKSNLRAAHPIQEKSAPAAPPRTGAAGAGGAAVAQVIEVKRRISRFQHRSYTLLYASTPLKYINAKIDFAFYF